MICHGYFELDKWQEPGDGRKLRLTKRGCRGCCKLSWSHHFFGAQVRMTMDGMQRIPMSVTQENSDLAGDSTESADKAKKKTR